MQANHLVVAASGMPELEHSTAAHTVCALVAIGLADHFDRVTIATTAGDGAPSRHTAAELAARNIDLVKIDVGSTRAPTASGSAAAKLAYWTKAILSASSVYDPPHLMDPQGVADQIDRIGGDAVLLFWDTSVEFALPWLKTPAYGYLARPPQQSALTKRRARLARDGLKGLVDYAALRAQERRHLRRMRQLRQSSNICRIDTSYYADHGVRCDYIPNTWKDAGTAETAGDRPAPRRSAETGLRILANISQKNATGNTVGMTYAVEEVLPRLRAAYAGDDWRLVFTGPGDAPPALSAVADDPHVEIKGFVDDLDAEIRDSDIFLLLNNAGGYTGGYTRIAYVLSMGKCVIAHANIRKSMPELVHRENCLLGEDPESIAALIVEAGHDPALRHEIGDRGRRTYEAAYAPAAVARNIAAMIAGDSGVKTAGERHASVAAPQAHVPVRG